MAQINMKRQVPCKIVSDIDARRGLPGAIAYAEDGRGMFYVCPCGCGHEGYLAFKGKQHKSDKRQWNGPTWEWDGNKELPTLSPSIHHQLHCAGVVKTHWHGYLRKGVFIDC